MQYIEIIIAAVSAVLGGVIGYLSYKLLLKNKVKNILKEATSEAEAIKKDKMLEVKEKFVNLKSEYEKQVAARNAKMQQNESRIQQKELSLNQRQGDLQRKMNELEATRENLDNQLQALDEKRRDLERSQKQVTDQLAAVSGLSPEEAKAQLVESLKEKAKTDAMAYVNEMMEEAKMTANKEAKRIIVQTIQRVATETAIENSVTVFNIESDEVKGRIIGREGRNIRALEAATGVEIIVDDTPEAIVLSGFDPVRREIARLALHQLVVDGRIHPARIEEVVAKTRKQVEEEIVEVGKRTTID